MEKSDVLRDNLQDLLALLALGGIGVVSLGLTGAVTQETSRLMRLLGLADEAGYGVLTWIVGIALAVAVDVVIFLWLLRVVPSISHPLRRLLPGALFGAAGFEVLKVIGGYYLSLISGSVTASAFGGAVGLLVWINLVARFASSRRRGRRPSAGWSVRRRSGRTAHRCPPDGARRRDRRRRHGRTTQRRPATAAVTISSAAPARAPGRREPAGGAPRRRRRRAGRGVDGAAEGRPTARRRPRPGGTRVPTPSCRPGTAKPQSSSRAAWSGGAQRACSRCPSR